MLWQCWPPPSLPSFPRVPIRSLFQAASTAAPCLREAQWPWVGCLPGSEKDVAGAGPLGLDLPSCACNTSRKLNSQLKAILCLSSLSCLTVTKPEAVCPRVDLGDSQCSKHTAEGHWRLQAVAAVTSRSPGPTEPAALPQSSLAFPEGCTPQIIHLCSPT